MSDQKVQKAWLVWAFDGTRHELAGVFLTREGAETMAKAYPVYILHGRRNEPITPDIEEIVIGNELISPSAIEKRIRRKMETTESIEIVL